MTTPTNPSEQGQAIRNFLSRLPLVMDEAHRIGLSATGHLLHEAVRKSGYEAAEVLTKIEQRLREDVIR